MNYEILKDDNMTVRQFLINRQIYKGGGPRRLEHILPGQVSEAVKCDAGGNRYYFLPLGRASVEGFASEDHENGVGAWQNIQSFRNDEMMSGINDATGRYIAEDGSENFHGILHAWTTAATCERCRSKYGSKLIFSTPICENNKYRGRHIREYDNSANFPGPVAPDGNSRCYRMIFSNNTNINICCFDMSLPEEQKKEMMTILALVPWNCSLGWMNTWQTIMVI